MASACLFPAPTDPTATIFFHTPKEHRRRVGRVLSVDVGVAPRDGGGNP